MSDYYFNRVYFVYRHVAPNGKSYIGITSKATPEERWGVGGSGYFSNKHFWNAIQKYGWDNFKHIVVAHGLSVDTACRLEEYLIRKYNAMDNGYNQTSGGVRPTEITDEIRSTISNKVKAHRASLHEGEWSKKFKGHKVSLETRKKISSKVKGRKCSEDEISRRVQTFKNNLTPEIRYKMGSSRGKHLSEETRKKLSEIHTGKILSEDTKAILRQKGKERYSNNIYLWVNNEENEYVITKDRLDDYLSQGYVLGRVNLKNIYVYKDDKSIKIPQKSLSVYLADGWKQGFNPSRYNNIKRSRQKFIYIYDNQIFGSGNDLVDYLRMHGYPKIVQGTVNGICQGNIYKSYPELNSKIQRRLCDENI